MIKFKTKQTNSVDTHPQVETEKPKQTYHPSQGIYDVDCYRCGVSGYCNASLFLHRGDICPEYVYDDGRAKDPDDF